MTTINGNTLLRNQCSKVIPEKTSFFLEINNLSKGKSLLLHDGFNQSYSIFPIFPIDFNDDLFNNEKTRSRSIIVERQSLFDSIPMTIDSLLDVNQLIENRKDVDSISQSFHSADSSVLEMKMDLISTIKSENMELKTLDTIPSVENQADQSQSDWQQAIQMQDSVSTKPIKRQRKKRVIPYIKPMDSVTISDYRIMYLDGRNIAVDTTLNIDDDYEFNALKTDYFEILPLPNMGQGFNRLGYDFTELKPFPRMGALNKHYGYFEKEDIPYYHVPSPLTDLYFKTTFEQGNHLDAQLTMNTSPKFNIYIGFKGFRSLGKYVSARSASSQFRSSIQYQNYSKRFRLRIHYATQLIENQVNGGLTAGSDYFYINAPFYPQADQNGQPLLDENGQVVLIERDEFLDRSILETSIEGNNNLGGKRTFIEPLFRFFPQQKDSIHYYLELGYHYSQENKYYDFSLTQSSDYFGDRLEQSGTGMITDRVDFDTTEHQLFGLLDLVSIGKLKLKIQYRSWDYRFLDSTLDKESSNSNTDQANQISEAQNNDMTDMDKEALAINGNQTSYRLEWHLDYNKNHLHAYYGSSFEEEFASDQYGLGLSRELILGISFEAKYQFLSRPLDFNYYLNKSSYESYNWNNPDWKNQKTSVFNLKLKHRNWGSLEVSQSNIGNFGYFQNMVTQDNKYSSQIAKPLQSPDPIQYLKVRFRHNFTLGKFSFVNMVQFQEVDLNNSDDDFLFQSTNKIINVPKWLMRSSFVFSSHLFNKQLWLNAGFSYRFFTDFYANQHNPLLGQFIVQNHTQIGEFPLAEVFVNLKVQQTRLFFKIENFGSWLEQNIIDSTKLYDFYSDPVTPYRDSILRFGLIWNFFQ